MNALGALLLVTIVTVAAAPVQGATLDQIVDYVTDVTKALPDHFREHGPRIDPEQPLPDDVMAYAKFYWTVDSIEGVCKYLGQRTNIEILAPSTGISTWVMMASFPDHDHRDYPKYMAIVDMFDSAATEIGELPLCSRMYALLGPNGTLMEDALDINGLIDPEHLDKWKVRVEDGVLWSSRDYCERRYYLEPPADEASHKLACEDAERQGF